MTAKGYVLVRRTVVDADQASEYLRQAAEVVAAAGGRYLVRGGQAEVLEGEPDPDGTGWVVIEFDSLEAARTFYHSAEYAPSLELAQTAFDRRYLLVEGVPQDV
ncbi:DUF1330 domain-containing protein [Desertihabitans brevis]|uniref:DUF1330 domain-containing protein n=1 Tax=Desertihabitans brevis TaxID=2268447 RepID=A0A367YTI7_9ACTN|nr:DUF1330 domain-containing protein [Desertihabitans brevis]RCK69067.1 DUF1330 domain-containing protein [Desertihabitans brevis]